MLQDAWSCLKMLVFDRLGLSPLLWHSAVQSTDTNLPFDILFLRNSEIGKKQQFWAGPPVNRLVPKII